MTPRMLVTSVVATALALLVIMTVSYRNAAARPPEPERSAFAQAVDLTPLAGTAVHENGRLKSFDSYASTMLHFIAGPHEVVGAGRDPTGRLEPRHLIGATAHLV